MLVDDAGGCVASLEALPLSDARWTAATAGCAASARCSRRRSIAGAATPRGSSSTCVEQSRAEGALLAALFSEIGTAFYERLGFSAVPLDEVTVRVTRSDGAPAMLVRAGDERDLPALAAMHDVRARRRALRAAPRRRR